MLGLEAEFAAFIKATGHNTDLDALVEVASLFKLGANLAKRPSLSRLWGSSPQALGHCYSRLQGLHGCRVSCLNGGIPLHEDLNLRSLPMASDSTGLGISPYAISVIAPIAKVSLMFNESNVIGPCNGRIRCGDGYLQR